MSATGLAFVLAYAVATLMALVRHPIYGLIAYVGVFYINPPARWWGQGALLSVRWSFIAAIVTMIAIAIHRTGLEGRRFFSQPVVWGFLIFISWLAIQLFWALSYEYQITLLEYYAKFLVAAFLIYRSVDTERHLRWFLWAHVLGCFYFGWLAYSNHTGGRFEDFGGAGVADANEVALTIGTSALALGSLFLWGGKKEKIVLVGVAPFLVNAIVATVSRSGFLALALGGLVFNFLTPSRYRKWVLAMSCLAVVLLLFLTTDTYWNRIETITAKGAEIEGVDTGAGRLDIMKAQLLMSKDYPLGCGHFCTTILSPQYLPPDRLDERAGIRSSHNTFLSMLVEQGIPGAVMYLLLLAWIVQTVLALFRRISPEQRFLGVFLPCVAGALAMNYLGDMFVPYVRFEVRIWFVALLMILVRMQVSTSGETVVAKSGGKSS